MYTANQLLDKSIQILLEKGWIRGDFKNKDGYCAVGALSQAAFDAPYTAASDHENYDEYVKAYRCLDKVAEVRSLITDEVIGGIMLYNDSRAETIDDVIAKFEEAKACANG